jgi:hypothetical protein
MLYLIAVLIPPLAILTCGKPFQAFLNGILWIIGIVLSIFVAGVPLWIGCIIHALGVVHNHYADQRARRRSST